MAEHHIQRSYSSHYSLQQVNQRQQQHLLHLHSSLEVSEVTDTSCQNDL